MVEFRGKIDPKLLMKAHRLQIARLTPFAIIMVLAALYVLASAKITDPASWGVPLFFLLLGAFLLASPYFATRTARKTNAALQSPISGLADDQHFVLHSEFAEVDIPWEKMHRATIRPELVLLHPSAAQAFVIAKQFFSSEDAWANFCQLVKAHVREAPRGSPILRTLLVWLGIIIVVFIIWSVAHRS